MDPFSIYLVIGRLRKYYVISKIFRNENTEKEELHHEAPLLLIVRINILISKKVVKKVVIQLIFIAM